MLAVFDPYSEILIRMLLASLLGGLVGLERDIHGRAAGLRTHLLVSLGAAVFTILSEVISKNAETSGFSSESSRNISRASLIAVSPSFGLDIMYNSQASSRSANATLN